MGKCECCGTLIQENHICDKCKAKREKLTKELRELGLPPLAINALAKQSRATSIEQIKAMSADEIRGIRLVGKKTLHDIAVFLNRPELENSFSDYEIGNLNTLSTKTKNALLRANVFTIDQLKGMTPVEIYRIRGIGAEAIKELGDLLQRPDVIARAYADCPTEEEEQITLFNWAQMQLGRYPELRLMFHIPNEGKRSVVAGKHMKAAGMRKGVSDIFLSCARNGKHGLYIEMKRVNGSRISKEQVDWLQDVAGEGYAAYIACGWKEAAEIITNYLDGGNQ